MISEIEINGQFYQLAKISAMKQTLIVKRLIGVAGGDILQSIAKIPDEDVVFIFTALFEGARRRHEKSLVPFYVNGDFTYQDINLKTIGELVKEAFKLNGLLDFLAESR
jgi:hypothetical protein